MEQPPQWQEPSDEQRGGDGAPGIIRAHAGLTPDERAARVAWMRDPSTLLLMPAQAREKTVGVADTIELIDVAAADGVSLEKLVAMVEQLGAEALRRQFRLISDAD